ncbi:MAG TPA: SRPBCC family protein [Azospirillaceae bacterium]|nr:SRPBCC family protein [Azospirillaceae bacterium]
MDTATSAAPAATAGHELVLTRLIDAPRASLYRCWTEPELLKRWFCPLPWTVSHAELDVRPGGSNLVVMRSPEGAEFPNRGIYLEVVENERIVLTDAYTSAWEPSPKPFMTAIITFEEEGGKTRYTARVRHWTAEDREAHEKMGFHEGWGVCADQLAALAATL